MEFNIEVTDEFLEEAEEIYDYISYVLKAEQACNRLRKKIYSNIQILKRSPELFAKIDKSDRIKRQYRRIVVGNYVILYTIDYKEKIVYISHIYYGRRNYLS